MFIITCISFGKNDDGNNITMEAKGMLRFIRNDHGKYSKSSKFPITGEGGTGGFAIYLEFTPEDKEKFMNNVLIVWPGNTDGRISGREMYNKILNIGKGISPDIESKMKKNEWGYVTQPIKLTLKPVKNYESCCAVHYYYAEIIKYEKIPSTTVKITQNMNMMDNYDRISFFGENDITYIIYSNIRKGPSKQYDVIKKIPNDDYVEMIQDFGEWKYIIYFEEESNEAGYGFVHKSQLKKYKY